MSRIYSAQLFSQTFAFPGTVAIPVGVAGQVVVIRSIDAFQTFPPQSSLLGFGIQLPSGATLFAVGRGAAWSFQNYHWEGRQVFAGGESLSVFTNDPDWDVSASGYILNP